MIVSLWGVILPILSAQEWPRAAASTNYLLDTHGVISGNFIVPEMASFAKAYGPALTPHQKDALATNLLLYYPNLYFMARSIASQNDLDISDVMYYSLVIELLQDDSFAALRGSETPGGYLGLSHSLGTVCNSTGNPLCIDFYKADDRSRFSHWKDDIANYFREATFTSASSGQLLGRSSYIHGTLNTHILAFKDFTCARILANTSDLPYLDDFTTLSSFIAFTHRHFSLIDGRNVPLAWRLTELVLQQDARTAYLEGHFYSIDKAHTYSSSLATELLATDKNAFPYYLASLVSTKTTFNATLSGVKLLSWNHASDHQFFSSKSHSFWFYHAGCTNTTIEKCRTSSLVMGNKLAELNGTSLNEFFNAMRTYPVRTSRTYATTISSVGNMYRYSGQLQTCTEIYDATKKPVGCVDPPLPTNWFIVIISVIIIGLTITAWVYGILFAKKYDQGGYDQVQQKFMELALEKRKLQDKRRERQEVYKRYLRSLRNPSQSEAFHDQ